MQDSTISRVQYSGFAKFLDNYGKASGKARKISVPYLISAPQIINLACPLRDCEPNARAFLKAACPAP